MFSISSKCGMPLPMSMVGVAIGMVAQVCAVPLMRKRGGSSSVLVLSNGGLETSNVSKPPSLDPLMRTVRADYDAPAFTSNMLVSSDGSSEESRHVSSPLHPHPLVRVVTHTDGESDVQTNSGLIPAVSNATPPFMRTVQRADQESGGHDHSAQIHGQLPTFTNDVMLDRGAYSTHVRESNVHKREHAGEDTRLHHQAHVLTTQTHNGLFLMCLPVILVLALVFCFFSVDWVHSSFGRSRAVPNDRIDICASLEDVQEAVLDHVTDIMHSKIRAAFSAQMWKLNQDCDTPDELLDQANWRERRIWVSTEGKVYYSSELNSRDELLIDDTIHHISVTVLPPGKAYFKHAIKLEAQTLEQTVILGSDSEETVTAFRNISEVGN